jgi:hypothetical protein
MQVRLKHEALLEESAATESRTVAPAISAAHLQLLTIRKFALLAHLMAVSPSSFLYPKEITTNLCTLELSDDGRPCFTKFSNADIKNFKVVLGKLVPNMLAAYFGGVKFSHPDIVTFSLMPALFGYFWCQENMIGFVNFLTGLGPKDQQLGQQIARVLFVVPEFLSFLGQVCATLNPQPENVKSQKDAEHLFASFRECWALKKQYCPSYIVEFLTRVKNPDHLLSECFFKPLFQHPVAYGIANRDDCWSPGMLGNIIGMFCNHARELRELILDGSTIQVSLQSAADVRLVDPTIDSTIVLCYDDLNALSEVSGSVARQTRGVVAFPMPDGLAPSELYAIRLDSDQGPPTSGSKPEELALRRLLIEMALVPVSSASDDAFELLQRGVFLSRPDRRLALSLQLARVRELYDGRSSAVLGDLASGFRSRGTARDSALRRHAACADALSQISSPIAGYLAHTRWQAAWPLQTRAFREWAGSRLAVTLQDSGEKFATEVIALANAWRDEQDKHGCPFEIEFFVLFDFALAKLTFADFRNANEGLRKADEWTENRMKHSRLRDEWAKTKGGDWRAAVEKQPFLIDEIPKRFAACYAAPSPAKSILLFVEIVQTCRTALQLLSAPDSALGEYMALVRDVAKPKQLVSWTAYIGKYFTILFQKAQSDRGLKSIRGSLTYVLRFLPKMAEAVNQIVALGKELLDKYVAEKATVALDYVTISSR